MPDSFEQRLELARKLSRERRYADAIVLLDWLCDAYPDRAAPILDAASAHASLYDYPGVAARFAQVESRTDVPGEMWLSMAQISRSLRRPNWAMRFFSNAVGKPKPSAEACGAFALFLERSNDLDQAGGLADRGLEMDRSCPSCQLAKAKVLRRQGSFDAAAATLKALLSNSSAPGRFQISSWYELALLSDAGDDCAGAISALSHAKRLNAEQPDHSRALRRAPQTERDQLRLLTTLNADYFKTGDRWIPNRKQPIALLGGHPRSGTTLLEQIIDSHRLIASAEETQVYGDIVHVDFFRELAGPNACEAALRIPPARLEPLREAYFRAMESVLDRPLAGLLLVDKNPTYTDYIPVYLRVFPECSFIISLRDPRDVVLSCYFQDLPLNESTIRYQTLKDTAMRYANTMAMWLICKRYMDEKKWIEVRYESVVGDLPGEARKIMDKLNLDLEPAQLQPDAHARGRTVVSPTYGEVTHPVHARAIGRWKRYERWLGEAMPILQPLIEAFRY